jgi:hypothetical protein
MTAGHFVPIVAAGGSSAGAYMSRAGAVRPGNHVLLPGNGAFAIRTVTKVRQTVQRRCVALFGYVLCSTSASQFTPTWSGIPTAHAEGCSALHSAQGVDDTLRTEQRFSKVPSVLLLHYAPDMPAGLRHQQGRPVQPVHPERRHRGQRRAGVVPQRLGAGRRHARPLRPPAARHLPGAQCWSWQQNSRHNCVRASKNPTNRKLADWN